MKSQLDFMKMPGLSLLATPAPYHIISYGTLLGTQIFHSFIGGILSFKVLTRPSFATLMTAIFPWYFSIQTIIPPTLALSYPGTLRGGIRIPSGLTGVLHNQTRWTVLAPLTIMFVTGLSNLVYIGPMSTRVMKERKAQETRDGKKAYDAGPHSAEMQRLNKLFGQLHGTSTLINLGSIMATLWYGLTLGTMIN